MNQSKVVNNPKVDKTINTGMAYLLWCSSFLSICGLHRFYSGKYFTGAIWLATFGLLGVGQFFDLFFYFQIYYISSNLYYVNIPV